MYRKNAKKLIINFSGDWFDLLMTLQRLMVVVVLFLMITISASKMSLKSKQTYGAINRLMAFSDRPIPKDCVALTTLLVSNQTHSSVELNACNLFRIRLSLIWTTLSIIITYSIVFIQIAVKF